MARSPKRAMWRAGGRHRNGWRAAGLLLVVLLALTGSGLFFQGLSTEEAARPPQPAPAAAPYLPGIGSTAQSEPADSDRQPIAAATGMAPAEPTELRIPRIDLSAEIVNVGIDEDGMVEVPPLAKAHLAGWYERGPTPGEIGNAVVVGHVDSSVIGPAVFFHLGTLVAGDLIEVERVDSSVATFVVEGVASYPKSEFPNELIYGPAGQANLRLVTCGGEFDPTAGEYLDNVVVFATLVPDKAEEGES